MPAIELRDDEIGVYDYEAVKARRARMWAQTPGGKLFPQKPEPVKEEPAAPTIESLMERLERVERLAATRCPRCAERDAQAEVRKVAPVRRRVNMREIQKIVATVYGITVEDILSQRRTWNVVRPRQEAMWLAKRFTLHSLPEIGRRFNGRDHTTVLHAVRKIGGLVEAGKYEAKAFPHVAALDAKHEALWQEAQEAHEAEEADAASAAIAAE